MSAIRNISLLWVGTVGGAGLSFLAQVIFARLLTPGDYGALASALVAVTLLASLAGFGIGQFWLKIFGAEGWRARRWLPPSLTFASLSCLAACLLLAALAWHGEGEKVDGLLLWLSPLVIALALIELGSARLQLEERYTFLVFWQLLPQAGRFAVAAAAAVWGGGISMASAGFSLLGVGIIVLGLFFISGMVRGKLRLVGHPSRPGRLREATSPRLGAVFSNSWPFALAGIFYFIYFQSDILLLKWLRGPESAGIYNIAFTIMLAVYLLPSAIYQKYLLPKQHRWAEHDPKQFLAVFRFGCGVMLTSGSIVMILLMLLAPWGVVFLFGEAFSEAGNILILLAICVPMRYLATSVGGALTTRDHMRTKVLYMGMAAGVNVVLNLILIPYFSYYGAAAATAASEATLVCVYLIAARRRVFGGDAWRGWTLRYERNNKSA